MRRTYTRRSASILGPALVVALAATACVRPAATSSSTASPSPTPASRPSPSPSMGATIVGDPGELVGSITVPTLGLEDYPMHMGTTDELLLLGVGVYTNAATPGNGNLATAGHRVTPVLGSRHGPYYDLDLLGDGDVAWIEYAGWRWTYRWVETIITTPEDVTVLADGRADLTMTACHPKFSKRERIVAFWKLIIGAPIVAVTDVSATPTVSPTPSVPPTPSPTVSPTPSPTVSPTPSPTPTSSPTGSNAPTATVSPSPSASVSPKRSVSPTPSP